MSKYNNKPIEIDGIKFQSMLEGAFYQRLKDYKKAGKIHDFQMQVPFVLHAGIKYKLDFLIYEESAQEFLTRVYYNEKNERVEDKKAMPMDTATQKRRYVEVKGYWTAVAKLKRKLFEADYSKLEIHTRDNPWQLEPNIVASQTTNRRSRSQSPNAPGAVKAAQSSHGGGKIPAADKNA